MAIELHKFKGVVPNLKTPHLSDVSPDTLRLEGAILSKALGGVENRRTDSMKQSIQRGLSQMNSSNATRYRKQAPIKIIERLYKFVHSPIPRNVIAKYKEDFDLYGIVEGDTYAELIARRITRDAFVKGGFDAWKLLEVLDEYRPQVQDIEEEDESTLERIARGVEEQIKLESTNGT